MKKIGIVLLLLAIANAASLEFFRDLYPEGMDWEAKQQRFLVGSMKAASIFSFTPFGELRKFVDFDHRYGLLGVRIDAARNRVLAVVSSSLNSSNSENYQALVGYDLDSRSRVLFARLDGVSVPEQNEAPRANDVAVDLQGNAYVTNTAADSFIWKVNSSNGAASVFASVTRKAVVVTSPGDLAHSSGLNGIVYHERGNFLLVDQSNTGALFRVHLADATVEQVTIQRTLAAADGMALREDGKLVIVSASKAWLLNSRDMWRTAEVEDEVELVHSCFATSVALQDGFRAFALCSFLPEFLQQLSREEFSIQQLDFPKDSDSVWLLFVPPVALLLLVLAWKLQMSRFFEDYKRKRY